MLKLLLIIFAYLLGSISSAIIACKLLRLPDPRTQGSGNPGATNVLRLAGKKIAVIVLIFDVLKGAIPVLLGKLLGLPSSALGLVALAAFLGHLFPIFFGFKGGKGVATAFGTLIVLAWPLALAVLLTWLIVAAIFRYASLAAVVAAALAPVYGFWLAENGAYPVILIMCLILIARHYENIQRLIAGTEGKIGRHD